MQSALPGSRAAAKGRLFCMGYGMLHRARSRYIMAITVNIVLKTEPIHRSTSP